MTSNNGKFPTGADAERRPAPKATRGLEVALIRLEYAIADFQHRDAVYRAELEALLGRLLAASRLVQGALAAEPAEPPKRQPAIRKRA